MVVRKLVVLRSFYDRKGSRERKEIVSTEESLWNFSVIFLFSYSFHFSFVFFWADPLPQARTSSYSTSSPLLTHSITQRLD